MLPNMTVRASWSCFHVQLATPLISYNWPERLMLRPINLVQKRCRVMMMASCHLHQTLYRAESSLFTYTADSQAIILLAMVQRP